MEPIKVMATIDGSLYEVEAKQADPDRPDFTILQDGKEIAELHKENGEWFANEEACLMMDDVHAIGKAIEAHLEEERY